MSHQPHCPRQTIATGLPTRLCLLKWVNNGADWLRPLGGATVHIGMRAMCPAASVKKFTPTENAEYSA
jgi:hypothetical protein